MAQYNTNTSKASFKPLKANNLFNQYLSIKKSKRTLMDIFLWWERKRIAFNIIVLALCYTCFEIQKIATHATADIFTKREMILFIIGYNIIYSSFCVLEFFIKKSKSFAPNMFKNALFICTVIVTIPTLFHILESIAF